MMHMHVYKNQYNIKYIKSFKYTSSKKMDLLFTKQNHSEIIQLLSQCDKP